VPGFIALILLLCIAATAAAADMFGGAPVTTATMGNGLKVIVLEDHSADLVAIDVWVKAGIFNETPENNGVSHFIEHVLFKRTARRGLGEADRAIESVGATLGAATSRDWAHFHTVVARRFLSTAMDVLADVITHPAFDSDDIERERRVILDEIARRDSDYIQVALNTLYAAAYTKHPYGMLEEGTAENVKKLTRQDILDYYSTYYVPNNMTVVVVGDIDPATAIAAVGEAFQGFKKKDVPKPKAVPEGPPDSVVRRKVNANISFSHVVIGFRAPSVYTEPDVYAADVLLTYLGLGYRSWLATELKEKQGLAVQTMADFLTCQHPSVISIYLAVKPENVEKAEQLVMAKIKEMREQPISQEELARAKRSLEGSYAFQNETFSGRANTLGFYESIRDYKFATNYIANVRAVTAKDVQDVVRKYLDPDRAIIVEVGP